MTDGGVPIETLTQVRLFVAPPVWQ